MMKSKDWEEKAKGKESDKIWSERIRKTLDYMMMYVHPKWKQWLCMREGDHWGAYSNRYPSLDTSAAQPKDVITVNQAGECAERMLAYLLAGNLQVHCEAKRGQDVTPALLGEAVLRDAWQRTEANSQIEIAVAEGIAIGRCWSKVWIRRELEESLTDEDGNYISYEDFIKEEEVYPEYISNFNIIWDLGSPTGKPRDGRWIGQLFYKSPIDILNNPDYDQNVLNKIKGKDYTPRDFTQVADARSSDQSTPWRQGMEIADERKWCLAEIWDKKFRSRKTYLLGVEEPILKPQMWWPHLKTWPLFHWDYKDSLYTQFPSGMMRDIEDLQYERDRMRTKMFKHRRTMIGSGILYSNEIDEAEVGKLLSGDDAVKVPVPVEAHVRPRPIPQIPDDEYRMDAQCRDDINTLSFILDILRGAAGADRESATSTQARSGFAMQVIEKKKNRLQRWLSKIAKQMLEHMRAFYDKEKIVRITGPAGEYWGAIVNKELQANGMEPLPLGPQGEFWQPYTKDNLDADVDVTITLRAEAPVNPAEERARRSADFQYMTNPNVIPIMQHFGVNYPEYIRNYFEKNGDKDTVRWYPSLGVAPLPVPPQTTAAAQAAQGQPPQPSTAAPPANPDVAALQQQNVQPMSEAQGMMGAMGPMMGGGQPQ